MKTDFLYCIFEAHSMPGDNVPRPDVLSTLYDILFLLRTTFREAQFHRSTHQTVQGLI